MTATPFSLSISGPAPRYGSLSTYDIDPSVLQLKHSTIIPGGFGTLEVGLADPGVRADRYTFGTLKLPIEFKPFNHVVLKSGGFTCFEGRMIQPRRVGRQLIGFTAIGYGLSATQDNMFLSSDQTAVTAGEVLRYILRATAPLINLDPGDFAGQAAYHKYSQFNGMFASQVIDQLSKEGEGPSGAAVPMDWAVWERRTAHWKRRELSTTAPYQIPEDDDVQRVEDYSEFYTTIGAGVNGTLGIWTIITASNPLAAKQFGITRSKSIIGGQTDTTAGQQFAYTEVALSSKPKTAITVIRQGRGLEINSLGGVAPGETVRAGHWLHIDGDDADHFIIQTSYDFMTQSLSLTLDNYPKDVFHDTQRLMAIAGHYQNGTSPRTGAYR